MIKKTFTSVALLALAACQQQEPAASPPVAGTEPPPLAEAQPPTPAPAPAAPALPPATPEERAKFFQACWASFNAKDWQKFQGCYAEAATSEQVDMGFPVASGRSAIMDKSVKQYAAAFPDGTGEPQLTLVNGNNIVAVVLFRGANSGPLTGPTGTLPATNKKVGYLIGHVVETTDDGRAVLRDRFYYDAGTMLGQLGVNPSPHRKVLEVGWPEKPVVLATNSETEKANLAGLGKALETFNKHDVNGLMALWTDDGVFSHGSRPADSAGKVAVKKVYTDLFKGFSDVKLEVGRSFAAGDYVVAEGTFTGTNNGDVPSMKLKKTGKKVTSRYLEIGKVQGGKIKSAWIFDNGMSFATQLGLVPPPGAKDPKAAPAAGAKDSKAPAAAPAAKDKDSKAATPATPATPGAKPATPATPASPATPAKDSKGATPATPATPAAPAAKPAAPAAPAAPAPAAPGAPAKK